MGILAAYSSAQQSPDMQLRLIFLMHTRQYQQFVLQQQGRIMSLSFPNCLSHRPAVC